MTKRIKSRKGRPKAGREQPASSPESVPTKTPTHARPPKRGEVACWTLSTRDLFPEDRSSAPLMLSLMIRMDDIRIAYTRFLVLKERGGEAEPDDVAEFLGIVRWTALCVNEVVDILRYLRGTQEVKRYLDKNPDQAEEWNARNRELAQESTTLNKVRNKLSGHLESEYIRKALADPGVQSLTGEIERGFAQGHFRYPIATQVLVNALVSMEGIVSAERLQRARAYPTARLDHEVLGEVFESLSASLASVIALHAVISTAYFVDLQLSSKDFTIRPWRGYGPQTSSD